MKLTDVVDTVGDITLIVVCIVIVVIMVSIPIIFWIEYLY